MKILIIGNGGREHAIGLQIAQSNKNLELLFAPGNPGMKSLGRCIDIAVDDTPRLVQLALDENIDLTIVGPEGPLVEGIVDRFQEKGLSIFGPSQEAAKLEGSKSFSKQLMKKYGIPTAGYEVFQELDPALEHIEKVGAPIVVKASGLAAGKGAIVCPTLAEAREAVESMLGESARFGDAGKEVVIEEFMEGEEASIFAVTDGSNYKILPSAQDHKRLLDGDQGPNTGGMGAYSPAPIVSERILKFTEEQILKPTLDGMKKEGAPYVGFLYIGLMIKEEVAKVVEFNCRLGDPEAQVILPLLQTDLLSIIQACLSGQLDQTRLAFSSKAASVVVLASEGYPNSYPKGVEIEGISEVESMSDCHIIQAGTQERDGKIVTSGGRVLGCVGLGDNLSTSLEKAYDAVRAVFFQGSQYRSDIGKKGLTVPQ